MGGEDLPTQIQPDKTELGFVLPGGGGGGGSGLGEQRDGPKSEKIEGNDLRSRGAHDVAGSLGLSSEEGNPKKWVTWRCTDFVLEEGRIFADFHVIARYGCFLRLLENPQSRRVSLNPQTGFPGPLPTNNGHFFCLPPVLFELVLCFLVLTGVGRDLNKGPSKMLSHTVTPEGLSGDLRVFNFGLYMKQLKQPQTRTHAKVSGPQSKTSLFA